MAAPLASYPVGKYDAYQLPNFTPDMQKLFQSLLTGIQPGAAGSSNFLSKLASGDEGMFEQLERPAYAAFEKALGSTASRFSQLGARNSSAFNNAIAGQGQDLAQNLQSQRLGLQQNAVQSLLGQSNALLGMKPYETVLNPPEQDNNEMMQQLFKLLPEILKLLAAG